jgi:hypothetical protein
LYIKYRLAFAGEKLVEISRKIGLHHSTAYHVIHGRRRSLRIEAEIARILGKASWNDVVLEARSEVQGKPVKVVLREMEQRWKARDARYFDGFDQVLEQAREGA